MAALGQRIVQNLECHTVCVSGSFRVAESTITIRTGLDCVSQVCRVLDRLDLQRAQTGVLN